MAIRSFLPSAQFAFIVGSILLSGGLVVAAEQYTNRTKTAQLAAISPTQSASQQQWQETLEKIQAESGIVAPAPPPEEAYQALITEAGNSTNITDATARSLFINLSSASAEGLGSDIPTQEQLIAQAIAQVDISKGTGAYTTSDLSIVGNTPESFRAYGNNFISILRLHPRANVNDTLIALANAVDQDNSSFFSSFSAIGQAYKAVARDLAALPVPSTLAPLHLSVVNNLMRIANTYPEMIAMPTDPLRGLAGLQAFRLLTTETERVFTTIAQQLRQNAILFTEDEPGSAWSFFLAVSP